MRGLPAVCDGHVLGVRSPLWTGAGRRRRPVWASSVSLQVAQQTVGRCRSWPDPRPRPRWAGRSASAARAGRTGAGRSWCTSSRRCRPSSSPRPSRPAGFGPRRRAGWRARVHIEHLVVGDVDDVAAELLRPATIATARVTHSWTGGQPGRLCTLTITTSVAVVIRSSCSSVAPMTASSSTGSGGSSRRRAYLDRYAGPVDQVGQQEPEHPVPPAQGSRGDAFAQVVRRAGGRHEVRCPHAIGYRQGDHVVGPDINVRRSPGSR